MALKAATLRQLRTWHLYLGLLFAPMLLLFSISGAVQTFRLPDQPGAPTWMVWIAAVHKDQVARTTPKPRRPRPPMAAMPADATKPHDKFPLQVFVGLLSIGLTLSTLMGIAIALATRATRRISGVLLVVGTVLPLGMLYL